MGRIRRTYERIMDVRIVRVFHHDSPGVRVYVARNFIQRALYPTNFSAEHETHLKSIRRR